MTSGSPVQHFNRIIGLLAYNFSHTSKENNAPLLLVTLLTTGTFADSGLWRERERARDREREGERVRERERRE